MIRKLQTLRAKKGFTLVELLVVIAIIGVLAAILIPLMNNYLRSARIQSANSTAASARNTLTGFMQDDAMRNMGLLNGNAIITAVANNGTFFVTYRPNDSGVSLAGYTAGADNVTAPDPIPAGGMTFATAINIALTTAFPDMQTGSFAFYLTDGYCAAAVYVAGVADGATGDDTSGALIRTYIAATAGGTAPNTWVRGDIIDVVAGRSTKDGTGVAADGTIVGTSPQQP